MAYVLPAPSLRLLRGRSTSFPARRVFTTGPVVRADRISRWSRVLFTRVLFILLADASSTDYVQEKKGGVHYTVFAVVACSLCHDLLLVRAHSSPALVPRASEGGQGGAGSLAAIEYELSHGVVWSYREHNAAGRTVFRGDLSAVRVAVRTST